MPHGVFVVESEPSSSDTVDDFDKWYDEVHIPEILTVEGFVSARRFVSADGSKFLSLYEIDIDIETAQSNLKAAFASGSMSRPLAVKLDPPPSQRYFTQISEISR